MKRFYGHFAAAYGTMFLILIGLAFLTQSHIETGLFGLVGFPIIAVIYAGIRASNQLDDPQLSQNELEIRAILDRSSLGQRVSQTITGPSDDALANDIAEVIRKAGGKTLRVRIEEV